MKDSCFLSIVVPVYNVERYLSECLDSILMLSFDDFEVICIDDCSTDDGYSILCEYEKKDSRIKVLKNKSNGGLSCTRNVGINEACGKYIWFVDADDIIYGNNIEKVNGAARCNENEIILFDMASFNMSVNRTTKVGERRYYINTKGTGMEVFEELLETGVWDSAVFRRWYRRDFILSNGLFFEVGIINEDVWHSFSAILKAECVEVITSCIYAYRVRPASITTDAGLDSIRVHDFNFVLNHIAKVMLKVNDEKLGQSIDLFLQQEVRDIVNRIKKMDSLGRNELRKKGNTYRFIKCGMMGVYNGYFPFLLSPEIMNHLRASKYIVIYGAGKVGKGLDELLRARGIAISCFAETKVNKSRKRDNVYAIDEVPYEKSETTVLVMVKSSRLQDEMKDNALNVGFNQDNIFMYKDVADI